MKFSRHALPALALTLTVSLALATTLGEVTQFATTLQGSYADLAVRIDACPDGTCNDRDAIVADYQALEADRAALHSARESLNPCATCSTVDALISGVDASAATAGSTIEEWDVSG